MLNTGLIGFTTGNNRGPNGEPVIPGKDEPATLPRVKQLIIISRYSPWCTIVKNDEGVTIGNVCSTIYKQYVSVLSFDCFFFKSMLYSYSDNHITEPEFNILNARMQEQIKRTAAANLQHLQPQQAGWGYYPVATPDRLRRVDWLRERVYFEGLVKDDSYAGSRLGFKAPDVFIMELVT